MRNWDVCIRVSRSAYEKLPGAPCPNLHTRGFLLPLLCHVVFLLFKICINIMACFSGVGNKKKTKKKTKIRNWAWNVYISIQEFLQEQKSIILIFKSGSDQAGSFGPFLHFLAGLLWHQLDEAANGLLQQNNEHGCCWVRGQRGGWMLPCPKGTGLAATDATVSPRC